jgi:hypothetical protein
MRQGRDAGRGRAPQRARRRPVGRWSKAPRRLGTPRQCAGIANADSHPPKAIQDLRWQAHVRRDTRSRRLVATSQHANVVTVAMARELVGCMWAMAKAVPVTLSGQKSADASPHNAAGVHCASAETPPRCGVPLDSVQSPPEHHRAEREADTRRRHGRGEPTHGEQQDHPPLPATPASPSTSTAPPMRQGWLGRTSSGAGRSCAAAASVWRSLANTRALS